jgi:hypothetical protein
MSYLHVLSATCAGSVIEQRLTSGFSMRCGYLARGIIWIYCGLFIRLGVGLKTKGGGAARI